MSLHTIKYIHDADGITRSAHNYASSAGRIKNSEFIKEITEIVGYKNTFKYGGVGNRDMEDRLQENQRNFEAIFQKSIFGNAILTTDLQINEVNEAFTKMLGYSKDQLTHKPVSDFVHPDYLEDWQKLQHTIKDGNSGSFNMETMLVKSDNTLILVQLAAIIFSEAKTNFGYIIFNDITENRGFTKESERVQENQQMFSSMIAHDLRSPLNTIEALSALIKGNIEEGEHEEALFHLSLLEKTNRTSMAIINDLMLIGELDNNKIGKQKMDVVTSVKSVMEQVNISAKMKQIQIKHEFMHSPVYVKANKTKLERVFQNLMTNAIKFSNECSAISVSVKQEVFSVLIKIVDKGIGIPLDMQSEVFNKFTTAKRRGTQGESTTGLGLFISKRIVDVHQGQIWLDSKQGEGTTFYIRLPLLED
ncbi:hypothetical protein BH23BAC2_BH23BAC2_25600 [soil metagenome]